MTEPRAPAPDARTRLRRLGDALPRASIGTVPILWNYRDEASAQPSVDAATLLDELARLGYEGTQHAASFPDGDELREWLAARSLRLAEVYAALPATSDGLGPDALAIGRERLRLLQAAGGDVLCVALDGSPERDPWTARAEIEAAPRLTDGAWQGLADVLHALADESIAAGARLAFHPHVGTFIETPGEVQRLVDSTNAATVGICLDVGHYLLGGGDPVAVLRDLGERVTHVHLKDVDPDVHTRLRSHTIDGVEEATRQRVFTELGAGSLDLLGCLRVLEARGYSGWLMVEQDSSWSPPSEAAAIGRRVLAQALRLVGPGS
jgi:inosose dehydratase